jgi:hypothetical protein
MAGKLARAGVRLIAHEVDSQPVKASGASVSNATDALR